MTRKAELKRDVEYYRERAVRAELALADLEEEYESLESNVMFSERINSDMEEERSELLAELVDLTDDYAELEARNEELLKALAAPSQHAGGFSDALSRLSDATAALLKPERVLVYTPPESSYLDTDPHWTYDSKIRQQFTHHMREMRRLHPRQESCGRTMCTMRSCPDCYPRSAR